MMLPSYRLLPRILRWFRRFRQRRGYGVHSPFAFEWITHVVYLQKAQYYAYAPLAEQHEAWQGVLSVKDARLLFRIANHQRAQRMLVVGQGIEREIHYLQAARPSAQIVHLPDASSVEKALSSETSPEQPFDFVLWMAAESPSLPVLSHLWNNSRVLKRTATQPLSCLLQEVLGNPMRIYSWTTSIAIPTFVSSLLLTW